jgi:hypothetical protein
MKIRSRIAADTGAENPSGSTRAATAPGDSMLPTDASRLSMRLERFIRLFLVWRDGLPVRTHVVLGPARGGARAPRSDIYRSRDNR